MPPTRKDPTRQAFVKAGEVGGRFDFEPEWAVDALGGMNPMAASL